MPLDLLAGVELVAEDNQIRRRNRGAPQPRQMRPQQNLEATFAQLPEIEALPRPAGYALEWGGEYESSSEARESSGDHSAGLWADVSNHRAAVRDP